MGGRAQAGAGVAFSVLLSLAAVPIVLLVLLSGAGTCAQAGAPMAPGAAAQNGIPANYLRLYEEAGSAYGLPWTLLAAIGFVESGHGSNPGPSTAGALGPMQFMPATWRRYGVDGNHDGATDINDPRDAIPGAANYLRASGAPGDLYRAIFAYNHADWYVQKVLAKMREYGEPGPPLLRAAATTTTPARPGGAIVLELGDSLAVGTGPPLARRLGEGVVRTLAARNRTSGQGLAVLRTVRRIPATLVVELGTNDTDSAVFRRHVLSVLAIARRASARVLWVNIARGPLAATTAGELNAVLTRVEATHDELEIVDWHGAVATGRAQLGDGVHPGPAGYDVRAQLIAELLQPAAGPGVPVGDCSDAGGLAVARGDGSWTLAPGANRPGAPLTAEYSAFVDRMAAFYPGRMVLTTGTNHSRYTVGGNVSDHWAGNAGDFGMVANGGTNDGPVGDAIAAAAFMAAGVPRDEAIRRGRAGGAHTVVVDGIRVQIIWKIDTAGVGDHHDHAHVGIGQA